MQKPKRLVENAARIAAVLNCAGRLDVESATVAPRVDTLMVDRWNGHEWEQKKLTWDGEKFAEASR